MSLQVDIVREFSYALLADWAVILFLIFGGCCSNAITLEQLTMEYPRSGSLITFCQFLVITIQGLPKYLVWKPYPRLKSRQIPMWRYFMQVALFYTLSSLNNAAFAYNIPMSVHIIFRSGGLVISMCMGYLLTGKRYNLAQIASVLLVTAGVVLTTLSGTKPMSDSNAAGSTFDLTRYLTGISLLTLALVLGGLLGVVQEQTYSAWASSQQTLRDRPINSERMYGKEKQIHSSELQVKPWQESMFYMHFLSMPMFLTVRQDLMTQMRTLTNLDKASPMLLTLLASKSASLSSHFRIPSAYIMLFLNTLTQIVCVSGVNRLTAHVSNLTVTLVLVVRKAVSLIISVWFLGRNHGQVMDPRGRMLLWSGAACVFVGAIGYSMGSRRAKKVKNE